MAASAEEIHVALESAIEEAKLKSSGEQPKEPGLDAPPAVSENPPGLESLITPEMTERFCQEAEELLQNVEQDLLAWEEKSDDPDTLADLFRHMHSFKGNCGFFGFADMERLAHQMETVLDRIKSGDPLTVDNPADTLLSVLDVLQAAVNEIGEGRSGDIPGLDEQLISLHKLLPAVIGEFLAGEGVEKEEIEAAAAA
ncbi:MAG TPA: Hpt domain-containing protein, partial [Desulfuromonadales bacterium]|nr:Hpt domain-containing protein [Desulfuromonadales bacterium]